MRSATSIRLFIGLIVTQVFFAGCGGGGSGGGGAPTGSSGAAVVDASAASRHYVEVTFSKAVDSGAEDSGRYAIETDGGAPLAVRAARISDNPSVVMLTTDAQDPVRYNLTVERAASAGVDQAAFTGAAAVAEPFLRSAVALDQTHVLLTFSEPMQGGANKAVYYRVVQPAGDPPQDAGNVRVLSASLSSDGKTVTLTTSPQEAFLQTVIVTNVASAAGTLIDPTRSSATFYGILPNDTSGPRVTGAVATNATTVVVSFSEPLLKNLSDDQAEIPGNYEIHLGDGEPSPANSIAVISAVLDATKTQVTLTTLPLPEGSTGRVTVSSVKDLAQNPISLPNFAEFVFAGQAGFDDGLPRVVGAASTDNRSVVVQFSRPMGDSAIQTAGYVIVQTNVNPEVGALIVTDAAFTGPDRTAVELTTLSQNELTYTVTVVNVRDLTGRPMAAKQVIAGVLLDPTSATFPGTPPVCSGENCTLHDEDDDLLGDNDEQSGWVVTIRNSNGTVEERQVTSSPALKDTDGDGLDDRLERQIHSDPRRADTDGDTLSDNEEYNLIYSDPSSQDSDADGIDDQLEVEFFKTNAILADSDGDGFSDAEELFEMNRDPRISDLPLHEIVIGAMKLQINEEFTYTDENGDTRTETSSTSATQSNSRTGTYNHLDQDVTHVTAGLTAGINDCQTDNACAAMGASFLEPARVLAIANIEGGGEWTSATTNENVQAFEAAFEESLEKAHEISSTSAVTRAVVGARMDVEVELRNASDVAFTLSNVEITVETTSPDDPTKFVPVATLLPNSTLITGDPASFNIGPYQSRPAVLFSNRDIFPNMVEDLMRAPRGLMFRVSNYDVTTEDGRNFAFGLQTVRERTTGIVVDFGDGIGRQTQVITAPVLNRARDELRCAPGGDHPDQLCETNDDCGTSQPCEGGQIVGGLAGYGGTGRPIGIPLDYVLRDLLHLRKTNTPAIVAGPDGIVDTTAAGDDVQLVSPGSTGLSPETLVVAAGRNGVLDTQPGGDDHNPTPPDGIIAGADKYVMSIAAGDDVQLVPAGTTGVPEQTVVISAGENGILETQPRGDDVADVVTGYETSRTCNTDTFPMILPGTNGALESEPRRDDFVYVLPFVPPDPPVFVIVSPSDLVLNSIVRGDDVMVAPGVACSQDTDCVTFFGPNARCNGPEQVVRVDSRRNGQFRRKWVLLLPDQSQFETDVGQVRMRPGQVLALAFVQDVDRDGLIAPVEFLYGSSDFDPDTDQDGLGDFSEVRIGWEVGVVGQGLRRVFPDPADPDSDGDGLTDREEQDLRTLPHYCPAGGCPGDFSLYQLDPRRRDTDGDGISDPNEVFGYLTGRGVLDPVNAILAGPDRTAQTVACPTSHCSSLTSKHCSTDSDCPDHNCVQQAGCDDVQVELAGSGVTNARTVVVSPGLNGVLETAAKAGDVQVGAGDGIASTDALGNDVPVVGRGASTSDSAGCVDGTNFFPMCSIVRPGPDGQLQTAPLGDDVLARFGQLRETTDPLHPDTDQDQVSDGIEQVLGSSPNDPGDTGSPADSDQDGLTDSQELSSLFFLVYYRDPSSVIRNRVVSTNPYVADTDADGLPDYAERHVSCTTRPQCVNTRCNRGFNRNLPCGGDNDCPNECPTDPLTSDTDGDGIGDYDELSAEQLSQLEAYNNYFRGYHLDDSDSKMYGTDPTDFDSDGDGLSDNFELFDGWTVTLGDGSVRRVQSDPVDPDTDRDGVGDGAEFQSKCFAKPTSNCPTDPSDPDTDDDGRLDGAESTLKTDPLVEDLSVRLRFSRIEVDRIQDPGGKDNAEFGWWIVLRSSALGAENPLLLSSAQRFHCENNEFFTPFILSNAGHCQERPASSRCTNPGTANGCTCVNQCYNINVNVDGWHSTISLDTPIVMPTRRGGGACPQSLDLTAPPIVADKTFTLQKGQSFTVDGLLSELDGASGDCGWAPTYIPSSWTSGCYTRFSKTYNFEDLQRGGLGETVAVNPLAGGVLGGDSCTWQAQAFLEVK